MIEQIPPSALPDWRAPATAEHLPQPLDVRARAGWQSESAHPAGAELLQMSMHTIPARLGELDPDRPVAVLCHHGVRSQHVAAFLAHHGFERVANVVGGIDAWSVQADPTVPRY